MDVNITHNVQRELTSNIVSWANEHREKGHRVRVSGWGAAILSTDHKNWACGTNTRHVSFNRIKKNVEEC